MDGKKKKAKDFSLEKRVQKSIMIPYKFKYFRSDVTLEVAVVADDKSLDESLHSMAFDGEPIHQAVSVRQLGNMADEASFSMDQFSQAPKPLY